MGKGRSGNVETSKESTALSGIVASRRALLAGVGVGALGLPFGAPVSAMQEAEPDIEVIVIGTQGDNGGMIGGGEDILIQSKAWALDMSQKLAAGGAVLVVVGGAAIWTGVGGFGGVGLVTSGGLALMLSFWLHQYALDPPQANYTAKERLIPLNVKFTAPQLTAIPALGQVGRAGNILVPTGQCMLDALERYQGAKLADDGPWMLRQRIAHDQLAALMALHLGQYSRAITGVSGKLKINPTVTPTVVSDFLNQYADTAKRTQIHNVLTGAGIAPAALPVIDAQLEQVVPANYAPDTIKKYMSYLSRDTKTGGTKLADLLYRLA
jgi:hypothetical protein